ncbi:MAG: proline--tRNA ligase, partial [Bifidobacteriaceae bacterium]|nr:proline--tRNA ligase [Bifidobacteriaceae bacterium]
PAHVHVVATGKAAEVFEAAEKLARDLESQGVEVLYDDRPKVSAGVKFGDAELLGLPYTVIVGKGLADGVVEFRDRLSGESTTIPVGQAAAQVAETVKAALAA